MTHGDYVLRVQPLGHLAEGLEGGRIVDGLLEDDLIQSNPDDVSVPQLISGTQQEAGLLAGGLNLGDGPFGQDEDPLDGEPEGLSEGGQVCTRVSIQGCTATW